MRRRHKAVGGAPPHWDTPEHRALIYEQADLIWRAIGKYGPRAQGNSSQVASLMRRLERLTDAAKVRQAQSMGGVSVVRAVGTQLSPEA